VQTKSPVRGALKWYHRSVNPHPIPLVTLITDFGTADGYAGAMKGVLLSLNRQLTVIDITHEVPPQDVAAGAFTALVACPYYPPGTVHVLVVDPGVGSERRILAAQIGVWWFVAPDNGLLTHLMDRYQVATAYALTEPRFWRPAVSNTFHGRDIMAPVAAYLTLGSTADALGPRIDAAMLVRLPMAAPQAGPAGLRGSVIHVDRFGNLISNLPGAWLRQAPAAATVRIEPPGCAVPLWRTYADVEPGQALALVGSTGLLEVAVRNGSAAAALHTGRGATIEVRWENVH
jgi:S-adenosylmethionine hydrolase